MKAVKRLLMSCHFSTQSSWQYSRQIHGSAGRFVAEVLICRFNSFPPEQNGRHFPDDIFKCIFMNGKFHRSLIPRVQLIKIQHWFKEATNHYLNQNWPSSPMHICDTKGEDLKQTRKRQRNQQHDNILGPLRICLCMPHNMIPFIPSSPFGAYICNQPYDKGGSAHTSNYSSNTSLHRMRQNMNQSLNPQIQPHTSSYAVSSVRILEEIHCDITTPHRVV